MKELKTKKVYYSQLNFDPQDKRQIESNTEPSKTIPNNSLTIPEILKRYASGRSIPVKVYDDYQGDGDHLTGVDLRTMDITEISELLAVTNQNIRTLKSEADRRRADAQAEALEKSIIEKYKAREKQKTQKDPLPDSKFIQLDLPIEKNNPTG